MTSEMQAPIDRADRGRITILINERRFRFDQAELTPADFREAVGAPEEYEVRLVVRGPDAEGQLPVDDEQITGPVRIRDGQRYRIVPPGTFGGADAT